MTGQKAERLRQIEWQLQEGRTEKLSTFLAMR